MKIGVRQYALVDIDPGVAIQTTVLLLWLTVYKMSGILLGSVKTIVC